ncbi:Outer membrane protein OmpA [Nitrosomonas sp. Nm58]|nr:Outer membrane protein OmpA [Nitrosomonas sp. Nm58]
MPEPVHSLKFEELETMNLSQFRPFTELLICTSLLAWACLTTALAQETQIPLESQKKQIELDRQQLELDKKQLELQRKQLQIEEAARKELQLKETEKTVTMKLEGDVVFDFGKAEIKSKAEQTLDKVGTVISQFPEGKVLIEGYTDSKGSQRVNLELSNRRAQAVKDWLVRKKGIAESIITTSGFGETKPVAPNTNPDGSDNPQGRQQNRRVEITVEKN